MRTDRTCEILSAFSVPKTPRQVEGALSITKLKLAPFARRGLLKVLNPKARKGRLYVLTDSARNYFGLSDDRVPGNYDYDLIGKVISSPQQRRVVLQSLDCGRRTSEDIRERASKINPNLSRTSTKGILKELIQDGLAETKLAGRKRQYWISLKGTLIRTHIDVLSA